MENEIKLTKQEAVLIVRLLDIGRMMYDEVGGSLRGKLVKQIEDKKKEGEQK